MARYMQNSADIQINEVSGTDNINFSFKSGNSIDTKIGDLTQLNTTNKNNLVGAINSVVESGTNSNGNWIKYADGTMIITQKYTDTKNTIVTMGTLKRVGLAAPPNFPIQFISVPNVFITLHHCWLGWLMGCEETPTTSNATGGVLIPVASAEARTLENVEVNILAIGKWR
jgi:hypothetical protein